MAYKKRMRENYQILESGGGSFSRDKKYVGRAVTMSGVQQVKLAGDGDIIKGSIEAFDGGQVIVIVGSEGVPFKNSGTTAIPVGSRIVGATRTIAAGGTAEPGYVKAFTFASAVDAADTTEANIEAAIDTAVDAAVSAVVKARGIVVDGGAANTANTDVEADVLVSMSC